MKSMKEKNGMEGLKNIPTIEIQADRRPTDYEYALLSQHIYKKPQEKTKLSHDQKVWEVVCFKEGNYGFYGAIYKNEETKQLVLSYRGTAEKITLLENFLGVVWNKIETPQQFDAFSFAKKATGLVKKSGKYQGYQLSFTGHSLGAFLAEMAVYYCHSSFKYTSASAVTFESPGTKPNFDNLQSNHEPYALPSLDIVGYVSYPNVVNTCNHHVGSLYSIYPELHEKNFGLIIGEAGESHAIDNIVKLFAKGGQNRRKYRIAWPLKEQRKEFYKNAERRKSKGVVTYKPKEFKLHEEKKEFKLRYKGKEDVDLTLSALNAMPLRHFGKGMKNFLKLFEEQVHSRYPTRVARSRICAKWVGAGISLRIAKFLLLFEREVNNRGLGILRLCTKEKDMTVYKFRRELSEFLSKEENRELVLKAYHDLVRNPGCLKIKTGDTDVSTNLSASQHLLANPLFKDLVMGVSESNRPLREKALNMERERRKANRNLIREFLKTGGNGELDEGKIDVALHIEEIFRNADFGNNKLPRKHFTAPKNKVTSREQKKPLNVKAGKSAGIFTEDGPSAQIKKAASIMQELLTNVLGKNSIIRFNTNGSKLQMRFCTKVLKSCFKNQVILHSARLSIVEFLLFYKDQKLIPSSKCCDAKSKSISMCEIDCVNLEPSIIRDLQGTNRLNLENRLKKIYQNYTKQLSKCEENNLLETTNRLYTELQKSSSEEESSQDSDEENNLDF